ncbi:MAG: sulfurtransferase, partial [Gammaproteobacteria bacterium]
AGEIDNIAAFQAYLKEDTRFADITFRESYSATQSFQRLKVKIKKEIITLRQPEINPVEGRAPAIAPETLKQWLDEKRDITILDTRNEYEVEMGAFKGAVNLHINHFVEFPQAVTAIERDKPVVMYCTGGIRCEKAALYMKSQGFSEVYQLDGGILNYFNRVGGAHYEGGCFVFDERVLLEPEVRYNKENP